MYSEMNIIALYIIEHNKILQVRWHLAHLFTLSIQSRCGLIQEQYLGVPDQSSSDGHSLLLAST